MNREKIEGNLLKDMLEVCAAEDGISQKVCGKVAKLYYKAVIKYEKKNAKMIQRDIDGAC